MTRIIAFCGPDGSGKTTQAELLESELNDDFNVRVVRPVYLLVDILGLRSSVTANASPRDQSTRGESLRLTDLVTAVLTYPYLLTTVLYLRVLPADVVICDRYVYQTLYDVYGRWAKSLLGLVPAADMSFLLNPELQILLSRMNESDANVDPDYYREVREFYAKVADRLDLIELPAERDAEQLHDQVRGRIDNEWCRQR